MWDIIKNLFKDKAYRNGMYIGSSQEFRDLYLQAEQLILDDKPRDALKVTKTMLLYMYLIMVQQVGTTHKQWSTVIGN